MDHREKTTPRIRGNTAVTVNLAHDSRQSMTAAERVLWNELRARKLDGLRFRAQHPVGPFILDFYCPSLKLVLEVDGPGHLKREDDDAARTAQLHAFGYCVIRFSNREVIDGLDAVVERIRRTAALLQTRASCASRAMPKGHSGTDADD